MSSNYKWSSKKKQKHLKHEYPKFDVTNHPLKLNIVTTKPSPSTSFIENLNKWTSPFEEIDPLLRFEQMELNEDPTPAEPIADDSTNYSKAWISRRAVILNKYTTGEKLTIISSFLPGGEKALIRQVSNLNEKVKHRLEQLDDFDEDSVRKTMGLSQQEFVNKINVLNDEIKKAWASEQRVKAFKIAIQCSKLLSDVNVMQFYPSKFVLITDILDKFGNLVFARLKDRSYGPNVVKSHQDIDPSEVPEAAKETCQNWLFKMASIRELLPRLYMEMSLLKCYTFISKENIKPAIARITLMIRGIGNPLVATYLRLYLCKVAANLLGNECEEFFHSNLKEFLEEYQQIFHPALRKKFEVQLLTLDKYLSLYIPAVDWLMYGTVNSTKCKLTLLEGLLQQCEEMENNELLLYCLISAFDSSSVNIKATKILEMVQNSTEKMVLLSEVLIALGEHLCNTESYQQVASESLIQTWWKIANSMKSTVNFLQVLAPWMQFACIHLSTQHVNIILRGTIRYMIKCGKPADEFSGNFQFVLRRMLNSIPDVEELFLMDAFMPLVELVQTSNARTMMAKTVLSIFFTKYKLVKIEDHIVIGSLMRLCCILHDSINAVTVEDEVKLCADLITKYIHAVDYHDDLEQQLNFYVESRAAFIKLDAVLVALVHSVNALAARGARASRGWLQRACAAYCFVTAPSLHCPLAKAQLYLLSGQVALLNNCIGQAEANFKALISLIPDIPEFVIEDGQKKMTHIKVSSLISDFLSTLLIMPDNMDSNVKAYILSGFIKTIERIHWRKTDPLYYMSLLHTLDLLCEMTHENYAYSIDGVISNDKLYGSDEEYIESIENYSSNITQEILVVLKALADSKETRKQYELALELFWRVIRRGDLEDNSMANLAANLWMLSRKLQDSNQRVSISMLLALKNDKTKVSQQLLQKLQDNA
ncbi:VPS35 endosomal protein-sorting factor-like isoform X2 [Choristoneura fumiferana]|uniref:VPS35 endosomal protein-sorting factor-like isoform X2 n=1 Tax=Choristoneura fumiferana TaxID=7141 RepID=UPI003D15AD28